MSWLTKLSGGSALVKSASESGFMPMEGRGPSPMAVGAVHEHGLDSNVIMAPVNWIMRNFTEAEVVTQRRVGDHWRTVADHDMTQLLETPNPFYGWDLLAKATVLSYAMDGNAYWMKVRNRYGEVIALWYLPHFLVRARWPQDGSTFISHYEVRSHRGARPEELATRDVVHFRFGLDPRNPRYGLSPLRMLLNEVISDEEASQFSAAILSNMGVPGGIISPKTIEALPEQGQVDELKAYMKSSFTGSRRGEWLVLGKPTEIAQFGYDPNRIMLPNLRDISEERVCATLGIQSAVVGFGSGQQSTKVGATMRELVRLSWNACLIPIQRAISRETTRQLLPDFTTRPRRHRVSFDNSVASAFVEEDTERANRTAILVKNGILRVDRAQALLGLEVDTNQAVYLRPTMSVAVPAEAPPTEPPTPGAPTGEPGSTPVTEPADPAAFLRQAIAAILEEESNP